MKESDVPVFGAAASQKESNLVVNFLEADLVKCLYFVQVEGRDLLTEDVVVGISGLVWFRLNTKVVVVVTKHIHALPEVPLILVCFHNLSDEQGRVFHYLAYHLV